MAIDFSNLITINKNWVNKEFNHHYTQNVNDKLKVRLYSIKPSGTTINSISLANTLLDILPYYFKSKSEIDKQIQREISKSINEYTTATDIDCKEEIAKIVYNKTYREAKGFFKKKSSDSTSGKYGELLLFGLVESVLDCKMIAHKITNLTNYHDEVKGGDGIFMGNYMLPDGRIEIAYLIGESKVWKDYSGAKKDALESINRFYDSKVQSDFKTLEFFIAQKDIEKVVSEKTDIDELYDRLDQKTELFKKHFESIAPSAVTVKVTPHHGGQGYVTPIDSIGYQAANKAYTESFGVSAIPVRSGGSIPIVALFEKELKSKTILMGFGLDSDAIHSPNEHYGIFNYMKGIETIPLFYKYFTEMYKK